MRRSQQIDFCRDLWPSNKNDRIIDDHDIVHDQENNPQASPTTDPIQPLIPSNPVINRLSLLPAYPTFDRFGPINRDHLLLANIPRRELTVEQRRRRDHHSFHQPFTLIDQSNDIAVQPFFVHIYHHMYADLAQRFHVDNAILDYNYERLRECINIVTQERIRHGLYPANTVGSVQLRIDEYALALEFYLQIDDHLFFMKTCTFRDAQPSLYNHRGIFCIDPPQAQYGMTPCRNVTCRLCFPITDHITHTRQESPIIRFSTAQKHQFVIGYEAILNCPVSCATKTILYALTCPCGHFDYIDYTKMTLDGCLTHHREQGNWIIHEFLLGPKNISRTQQGNLKSKQELFVDVKELYEHSTRCSSAIQLFLDCNPAYWCFVPMQKTEAQALNIASDLPTDCIRLNSTSSLMQNIHTRRDQEASICMNNLPPMPSDNYIFSAYQRTKQFQAFKDKRDPLIPNFKLDLYNATIIAVLPNNCSDLFYRTIAALFVTHAQTKLNTLGHLDGMLVENSTHMNTTTTTKIPDPADWCRNLIRRPTMFHETRAQTSYRMNPHFQ